MARAVKILSGSAYLDAGTNWTYGVIDERGLLNKHKVPTLTERRCKIWLW